MPVINTHQNIAAFLDMLAYSEGTANHPLTKNRGYDVIVTGLDGKPEIFTDYSDHPFAHGRPPKVFNRRGEKSTASGRYQQLYLFWPHYKKQLSLPDFSPLSQDRLAIQLIRERGAIDDIRCCFPLPQYLGVITRCRLRPARAQSRKAGHCLAQGWRGGGMKVLITLLVLAVLGLLWLRHENGNLYRSFEAANRVASEQKTTIGMLKNQLSVAGQLARRNESAQVALREQLAKASAEASRREQTITRLLNENEAFRRWYNAALPDVVRRLHTRPACASAGDCGQRMPEGEPLPDAGK